MSTPRLPLPATLALAAACAALPAGLSAQTVLTLHPSADTWVRSGFPTTNFGTATELLVGTINPTSGGNPGADVSGADVGRLLVSFNLADPAVVAALSGQTITSVTLTFTVNSTDTSSVSTVVSYSLFQSGTYNAGSVTWDSGRPAPIGSAVSTLSVNPRDLAANDTVLFGSSASFTSLVSSSLGDTLNLLLKQTTEGTPASRELLRLRSVDYTGTASDPVLTITAIPEPSAFAALAGLGMLGFAATRRRRR